MKKIILVIGAILVLAVASLLLFFQSDSANPYEEVTWGKFNAECTAEDLPDSKHGNDFVGCDYSVPESEIPKFSEIDFPFTNVFDNSKSLPLTPSALIDLDGDGVDEVFVGGGIGQQDALFQYAADGFFDISTRVNLPEKPAGTTTYGGNFFRPGWQWLYRPHTHRRLRHPLVQKRWQHADGHDHRRSAQQQICCGHYYHCRL